MIRIIFLFFILIFIGQSVRAQVYGNEWINYSQQHFTFKITTTGVHRINYDDLLSAGVPLSTFTHQNIQLFGREKEVPIWVQTNGDGSFDSGDYFLFHADKNDGWIDSAMYVEPDKIGNPKYSLFNDTIRYFFTWNNSTSNLRFTEETDVNFNSYTPSNYVWDDYFLSFSDTYHEGEKIDNISSSFYVAGEGYGNSQFNGASTGNSLDFNAITPNPYIAAGAPVSFFSAHVVTTSNANFAQNIPNHHTRWEVNGQIVDDQITQGYRLVKTSANFASSLLTNTTPVTMRIVGDLPVLTDFQAVNFWSLNYPRIPNFGGATNFDVEIENEVQGKVRLDISNLSYSQPILFSLDGSPKKLPIVNNLGVHQVLIPNAVSGSKQRIVFTDLANVIPVTNFELVGINGYFSDYSALNFESALILVKHKSMDVSAANYRDYRQSFAGGSHNAHLIDVDQLYLQFGGGVEKHILAIRRFAFFAYNNSTQKPVGLFLMGKGVANSLTRTSAAAFNTSLIPTWGVPASDVFLTSNLPGTTLWSPLIPTGRISVNTDAGLENYLSKVREYEQQQVQTSVYNSATKDWQKHAIHLVGGTEANQQIAFQYQMSQMKAKFETDKIGGEVITIKRDNDDPINPTSLAEITQRLEDGISLMTYYGHYGIGVNGFEINIDDVSNWNNAGKYPIMLVNSCYNGNVFSTSLTSSSEYFVNAVELGAIAYLASVSQGFHPFVGYYSNEMYRQFGNASYGESIGMNMKRTIEALEIPTNLYQETTCAQNILNGDPMIRFNYHNKPEIELVEQNVSFSPSEVDLTTDSIEMKIILKNLGQSIITPFQIEIKHNFPGSDMDSIYFIQRSRLDYTDTIYFRFPLQPSISVGINTFDIKIDIPSFIPEQYDEITNNQIIKSYFLNIDGILPVVPYEFEVVPSNLMTVKASTINPIAELNTYRFQIDTTDLFNSPFLRNATVTGLGGVKQVAPNEWDSPLLLEDSVVYFWRVAIDEPTPNWAERSFQYIPGKSGWGQDHFFQFKKNNFFNIDYNRTDRLREWQPDSILLTCDIFSYFAFQNGWYLDGTLQDYSHCTGEESLFVGVVDPITFESWGTNYQGANPANDFGNIMGCRTRVEKYFIFRETSQSQLEAFQNMVLNEVPDGYYLLVYSPVYTPYNLWNSLDSADMYQTFATLGATQIVAGQPNDPFIFFTRKGYPSSTQEVIIDTGAGETAASLSIYLYGADVVGQETSTLIGPAFKWGNVYWKQDSIDILNNADTTRLEILAYNPERQLAFSTNLLFTANDSLLDLNSIVDANLYPYIRLKASYKDTSNFTPAQIDRWHVLYEKVPEAAIDGSNGFTWSVINGQDLNEGEEVTFAIDVKNIYDIDMDSLLITYWVEDYENVRHFIQYPRQDSLKVGQTLRDTITFSTLGFPGQNSLWMEVNPYINGSIYVTDQPEQEHFNNLLQVPFFVIGDDQNPILDVTFSGRHILNGDIVDPNSEIYITLKDDNDFLVMDNVSDTSLFGIYLTSPDGVQKRIPFMDANGNTVMQWIPAEQQNKKFKIIYPAGFQQNGKYKLLVQGSDRSGNLSGDLQYSVSFEVIRESSITQMMNYPNPFSTSTRFVFTLTGTEVPDDIIIQIMTVSGRVVREITEDQLGKIYIGRNVTEYAWDGRDEFGDQLANGVYLYNVRAKINGENIEQRASDADQYFKKNFGKMYLMR